MKHRFPGLRPDIASVVRFTSPDTTLARAVINGCRWLVGKEPSRDELKVNATFDFAGMADKVAAATDEAPYDVDAALLGTLLIMIAVCQSDAGESQDADIATLVNDALAYLAVQPPDAATPGQFDLTAEQLSIEDVGGLLRVYVCFKATRSEEATWRV